MDIRSKAEKQEKRIAASLSQIMAARRQKASGAVWTSKGDVISELFLVEAKTKAQLTKSFAIKRKWLEKIDMEAFLAGKIPALAFSFGDNVDYFVLSGEHFLALTEEIIKYRREKDGIK